MQNRTLTRFANWMNGKSGKAAAGLEALEARQMMSADLPSEAAYVEWGSSSVPAVRGSYVITFDERLGNERAELLAREAATRLGVTVESVSSIGRGGWAELRTNGVITRDAARRVSDAIGPIVGIEPNVVRETTRVSNDPQLGEQWGLRNTGQAVDYNGIPVLGTLGADIHAAEAWDITIGSRSVVIAVIDTGVDLQHPDLAPNIWVNPGEVAGNGLDDDGNGFVDDVNGWDFGVNDSNPDDVVGHGTMVASCIGAVGNNGVGVSGVAWNVQIMALKIATSAGGLSTAAIIGAHDYATMMREDFGINLVASNNSYGAFAPAFYEDQAEGFIAEKQAIERFVASGATFVAAAGNNGANNDLDFTSFPASYNVPGVISVAATTNLDDIAGFSNFGVQTVDVAAPGERIWMATNGGSYGYADGTSFASPIVTGIVALIHAVKPNASAVEIREALIAGSDPLPALQGKVRSGGRVNAARTLQIIQNAGPQVRAVSPGPVTGQLNPSTNTAINSISITFTKDIAASFLSTSAVTLRGNGLDNISGNGDDNVVTISSLTLSSDLRTVTINLNLAAFALQRLPLDQYTLTLSATGFRDTSGNFLGGNTSSGTDSTYNFTVVAATGAYEQNDTTAQATSVVFDSSGGARYSGVTLGDGLSGQFDVDLFRVDMPRGGLITAETFAQRLSVVSGLDSYLRLFDANGAELASNDQFAGNDSFLDFFVATGGTYYIGVSGFGNDAYNPAVAAAPVTQSLGVYDVEITIDLVDDDVVRYTSAANSPAGTTYPIAVPRNTADTSGNTDVFIDVADTRQILDLNIRVAIIHEYTSDLQISLISPNGTTVRLFTNRGGNGDNLGTFDVNGGVVTYTLFDDEAAAAISAATAPFVASGYRPEQSLGLFDGQTGAGRWTLKINDTVPQHVGQVVAWDMEFTFQNDIFGPFELNDTLTTAKVLTEFSDPAVTTIVGTGTAQRSAFLGDGAFGNFDRDIFRFEAAAGGTLTAVATPNGTLNTALRLFDSLGTQIILSNPTGSASSRIENYVFAFSGTYYLAVTDGNNIAYTPATANNGTDVSAGSTGAYTLDVSIAAGVSDGGTVLAGGAVSAGINTTGTFGVGNTGIEFNGVEFLSGVGGIRQFLGGSAGGYSFTNEGPSGTNGLPFSITVGSDTYNQRLSAIADFRGMRVERVFSFGANDSFIAIDMFFTNTTASTLTNVSWMEGFNPDQGLGVSGTNNATRNTENDVDAAGKLATARFDDNSFPGGLTVGFGAPASDTRAAATVLGATQRVRDSSQLVAAGSSDPNGVDADSQLAMSFDLGSLAAGTTTSIRYFIFLGSTAAAVAAQNAALNDGTGTGHLTADSANPSTEALQTESTETVQSVPTLPYRQFFPEGFFGSNVYTFLPVSNPNNQATRVVIVARFEEGYRDGNGIEAARDQVLGDFTLAANSRDGLTLVTPDLYLAGNTLLRPRVEGLPYSIELRSERPVAATFSHYDLNLVAGTPTAVGESFTTRTENTWTFANLEKGAGHSEFITMFNPNNANLKVTATFFQSNGGASVTVTRDLGPSRRSGIAFLDFVGADPAIASLADGTYGVVLTAALPFVASITKYDSNARSAEGMIANAGAGSLTGAIAEGELGLNGTDERLGVLNAGSTTATVILSFIFSGGSTYRTSLSVPARSQRELVVGDLPNFPSGQPYGMVYESDIPVSVALNTAAFGEAVASATADKGYTLWGFAEGFRPGDNDNHPGVTDYLRLYNPSSTETVVEITIDYFGGVASETFRRVLPARRISEFNVDQFIGGSRRASFQFYGVVVKSPTPIVAFMGHFDRAFPGAFGTLGTPLGLNATIS